MRALITDSVHEYLIKLFEGANVEVDYHPNISLEDTRKRIAGYEILIINSKIIVDREFLLKAEKLKIVGRLGSGMEIIDQKAAKEHGVVCLNSPEGNRAAVAEHCVALLMALSTNLLKAHKELEEGIWDREGNRGREVAGRTAAIIGFGNTGTETAARFAALGMQVIAFDKYKEVRAEKNIKPAGMAEIFERADICSLHLPYTAETHHLADRDFFHRFEKKIAFINTSRGPVVNTPDLVEALDEGIVRSAGIDVFEEEGKPSFFLNQWNKQLLNRPNVILTPHVAGWTVESKYLLAKILGEKVLRYI